MIHHLPHRQPFHDFPADEWNIIEKGFHPEFLAQLETVLALGNGYLGMRGCPKEGGPNVENATLINGTMNRTRWIWPANSHRARSKAAGTRRTNSVRQMRVVRIRQVSRE